MGRGYLMNNYLILHTPEMGLYDDYIEIKGKTGVEALNNYLPEHWIGKAKRVRARDEPEYCLQKFIVRDGIKYKAGHKVWYKYHHPTITRVIV